MKKNILLITCGGVMPLLLIVRHITAKAKRAERLWYIAAMLKGQQQKQHENLD